MRGESALELLMTYGWALLIIVVVGASLYALGVLNPATYSYGEIDSYCDSLENKTTELGVECSRSYAISDKLTCKCMVSGTDSIGDYVLEIHYYIPEELQ